MLTAGCHTEVSNDHACPPGAGAGLVLARPETVGWLDGIERLFGSVESPHPPKCRSSAMNMPAITSPCLVSWQSPKPEVMWMSIVSGTAGGPAGPVLSNWTRYHGVLPIMLASFGAVAISNWMSQRSSPSAPAAQTAKVKSTYCDGSRYLKKPPIEI